MKEDIEELKELIKGLSSSKSTDIHAGIGKDIENPEQTSNRISDLNSKLDTLKKDILKINEKADNN